MYFTNKKINLLKSFVLTYIIVLSQFSFSQDYFPSNIQNNEIQSNSDVSSKVDSIAFQHYFAYKMNRNGINGNIESLSNAYYHTQYNDFIIDNQRYPTEKENDFFYPILLTTESNL